MILIISTDIDDPLVNVNMVGDRVGVTFGSRLGFVVEGGNDSSTGYADGVAVG
jgi:hypothetical protein